MDLQTTIDSYLAGDPKIPDDIIFRASQMFNSKLSKFNFKRKGGAKLPSMSQVGKPFCQLHAEKLGWKKAPESNSFRIKMLYGDMTEVIAVAILLAAGVEIVDLNKRVGYKTPDGDYINGELDLVIRDGNGFSLWDMKIVHADPDDEESYTNKIEDTITRYKEANEDNFVRGFTDEEEFFYRKPTGNRKLKMACSYCSFRYTCWPNLKYERNPKSKSANAYHHYTVFK